MPRAARAKAARDLFFIKTDLYHGEIIMSPVEGSKFDLV